MNVDVRVSELFNNPTIRQLGQYIEKSEVNVYTSIEPVEEKEVYEVSSGQKRLYALNQFAKEEINYNIPSVMVVEGKLDKVRVEEAFKKLVERHDSFRTSFEMIDENIVQRVHKEAILDIEYCKIADKKEIIDQEIQNFIRTFDLSKAPLLRVKLAKVSEEKYILMFDMHHIISDGVSINIIMKEFSKLYSGEEIEKPKLQYKDYAVWQKNLLNSDIMKNQEEYWLDIFNEEVPVLDMPTDYPRPTMQSFEGESIEFKVDKELAEKIKKISKVNGTTMYMTLLAAYNILLSKYSGQEDIVVGLPIAGRPHAQLQDIVGMFVNTLAMRNYPKGEKTFKEFLQDVKKNSLNAYENQEYQLDQLVEKLDIRKELSRNALFDTMFVSKNIDMEEIDIEGITLKPYGFGLDISKFDITLTTVETEEKIEFNLEYCTKLFKRETIERLKDHFINILKEVVENPEKKISEIDMLSEEEKKKILVEFNDTNADYPKNKIIYELFEEQVEKTPENIAVVYEEKEISYRELNKRANQLARVLREKGVGPDKIVGIMVERSLEMIVGIMGILKSGGIYLPINPEYPNERIEYMLEDSSADILLTQTQLGSKIEFSGDIIEMDKEDLYVGDSSNLNKINKPNDLAYIIYTSGTTGKPKGVMIEHKSMFNTVFWRKNEYELTTEDNVLQILAFYFDGFVTSFFVPIISGSKVILLAEQESKDPVAMASEISNKNITHFISVPALYTGILEALEHKNVQSLKSVTLAGESITYRIVEQSKKVLPETEIINEYGPTENTVATTIMRNVRIDKQISIGKPISNSRIYVVDKNSKLQPVGIIGELCISGDGLARGYLNRPELTKEKFVENPFNPGERMYKTGDLARWLPDGNIEFIGRIDDQVKIRGFRIELGEIESQLLKHEEIKEAVVIDREDKDSNKYLCAYVVSNKEMTVTELREHLSKELPDYMVPAYFMQLEKIPLTPNGKIDRKALPEPDGDINTGVEYVAPRNEIEEKIVKIWSEVLGVEKIGIDDNFFALGGDSIKAIQISARLGNYKLKINVNELFKNPNIRELSASVRETDEEINQSVIEGKVELTAIQEWFIEKKFTNMHHWNQAFMLYSKEGFNEEIIGEAFTKIVEHHDALRIVIKEEKNSFNVYNRGIKGKLFDLKVVDLSDENSYEDKIVNEANKIQSSINLFEGPLVKLGLFKTRKGDHLLIAIHHLVIDGVSWRILFEDFNAAYKEAINRETIILPEKTHSFKTWSEKIQNYARSSELLKEIDYWSKIENIKIETLPKDNEAAVDNKVKNSAMSYMRLSTKDTEKLLKNTNNAYNTEINDILLSALGLTIKDWTGENKVLINLEGHGREEIISNINITRTVGWFTSQYPLILNVTENDYIGYYIKSVKEDIRKIPNKGIGYGILKYITPNEYKNELEFKLNPQISFNYLGQFDKDINQDLFGTSEISAGKSISEESQRICDISINGMVIHGELQLSFGYNREQYNSNTIEKLAISYKKMLLKVINHCIEKEELEMTPSDLWMLKS